MRMTCGVASIDASWPEQGGSVSDKKSFQTLLTTTDYRPPEGFDAFPTPIHHASTVLFRDVAALRSRNYP